MHLSLYDTESRSVRPLDPVQPGHVGIYLCGPTVQGSPHIGHLRAAVSFDSLIRWLSRSGQDVTYVRNITDIDDKILANAAATGEEWWALASRFEREFAAAYDALGLVPPTFEPRATAHIIDQIALVERLIERGHAYHDGAGNVYFDVRSWPQYGSLTNQHLDNLQCTEDPAQDAQIEGSGKRDPRDFALWKSRKPAEPETASWPSPWGPGRPGWHLECSAMSRRYLGEAFDIHGGGLDLRFPHHENEMAQSNAAGWPFARNWVHNAWVTQSSEKMSKSLGNTLSLGNLLDSYPAAVIRVALGTVHYRSMIEWTDETLPRAAEVWQRLQGFVAEATAVVGEPDSIDLTPEELPARFTAAMDDDLNVAAALAEVYAHIKQGRRALRDGDQTAARRELQLVRSMLDVLGIDPGAPHWQAGQEGRAPEARALDVLVQDSLVRRSAARAAKDWAAADAIRDALTEAGVVVEDGPAGSTWKVTQS